MTPLAEKARATDRNGKMGAGEPKQQEGHQGQEGDLAAEKKGLCRFYSGKRGVPGTTGSTVGEYGFPARMGIHQSRPGVQEAHQVRTIDEAQAANTGFYSKKGSLGSRGRRWGCLQKGPSSQKG